MTRGCRGRGRAQPQHYDPIVCGYQPAVRTTGGPW